MKSSFLCHNLSKLLLTPPTLLPLTLPVTDGNHKTQTYCLNKLCPKNVECLKTLHLEL